ncbi:extracellular solute-binding protein [Streptomyces sp. JJ36]|uniref:extracellular solute-binding protein n=1 Tax=Streptomyces sp. JJ36 TaxID=2736645 RepID=UPI001F3312CA|nr:extracellular solute-binding protein [Streptomyces sp. JJ36]MCF6523119.1 extracellular solute-binding protein [Streptomyces sp. JJ36]
MRRRRFLRLAAATGAAGTVGLTTGCGGTEGTTLRVVAADYGDPGGGNGSQAYWDDLARAFEKEHPGITVEVAVHPWTEVDRKVAALVKDGRAPDIAQIGSYAGYADEGRLYSARELLPIPVQADFLPGLAEAGEVRRTQYGLPFVSSTRLLFYNRTLFTRAGLDPDAPPESWEELREAAAALREADVRIPYGLPLGPEEAPAETMMWLLGGGGGYTDNVGNYTIDSTENIRTFTWLRDRLVGADLTGTDPARTNRQAVFDAFARGEVGMLNGHPTLMQQADRHETDYGTAVLPGRGGPARTTMGVADWAMAFRRDGNEEAVGTFLTFVFQEENHYAFADRYDLLPVTTSASARMKRDPDHEKLATFLEELPTAHFYPVGKVSWGEVSRKIKDTIGEAVRPDGDPAALLGEIQRVAYAAESPA